MSRSACLVLLLEVIKLVVVDKYTFADDEYSDEDIPEYQWKAWEWEEEQDGREAKQTAQRKRR